MPSSPLQIPITFPNNHSDPSEAWDDSELINAWDAAAEEWKVGIHGFPRLTPRPGRLEFN